MTGEGTGRLEDHEAVESRRGRRVVTWIGVTLLVVWVAGAVFLAGQYFSAPSFAGAQPAPGASINASEVSVRFAVSNLDPERDTVSATIDGGPVDSGDISLEEDAVLVAGRLADGRHSIRARIQSSNVFGRDIARTTWFDVDTVVPEIDLAAGQGAGVAEKGAPIRFSCTEPVDAVLRLNGTEVELSERGGELVARPFLEEGVYEAVLEASDEAGNAVEKTFTFYADYNPPVATVEGLTGGVDDPVAVAAVRVGDTMLGGIRVEASAAGRPAEITEVTDLEALYDGIPVEGQDGLQLVSRNEGDGPSTGDTERYFRVTTVELAEGRHTLSVTVTDRGGNSSTEEQEFLVDSTSQFGSRPMVYGAEGPDVEQLQNLLRRKSGWNSEATGVLDEPTLAALVSFKEDRGLGSHPVVDARTAKSLLGSVTIDLSERRLYLYDGDELVGQYPVAVGQPQYPTPTGAYRIVNKARNPTWTPPPSPWAEGLEPVPPGPNNPLGTRWMGISAPHVGIHGTYASGSVGTAASHGCVRMYIRDVEELFELVYVGTPVKIVP